MIIDKHSPIPQYFQLQTWLIEQIEQGVFRPQDKIPTESEIQEITGLARATIRQAVQNLVNMGYLARKRRLGTFVLDFVHPVSKHIIIGVIVPDIRSGYSPELARGTGDEAVKSRHNILLCNTDDLYVKASFHAERLIETGVSGVIFVPTASSDEKNRLIIEKFQRKQIPVVLADRLLPGMKIDSVTTDNFEGGRYLTNYLLNQGHQKICIILSSLFSTERERLDGYKKALADRGLAAVPSLMFTHNDPFSEERYQEYARKIFTRKEKFTAIFAGHDRIAFVLSAVAAEMGIKIPQDVSIVGYDDLPFTGTHPLGLTTMHQPIYEIGQESMKLILDRIAGNKTPPRKIVLQSHFVERTSVQPLIPIRVHPLEKSKSKLASQH